MNHMFTMCDLLIVLYNSMLRVCK